MTKTIASALLAGVLLMPGNAWGQSAPAAAPPQLPPGISQSSAGPFKVIEIATTDAARFQTAWAQRKDQVSLPTSGSTVRNLQINTYIIFTGCKVDANGNCNVVNTFEVYDPDGGVYAKHPPVPQWQGPPAPGDAIMLGSSGLGLIVENGEKLGVYRIRTFTTDKNANVTVANEIAVTVGEAK